MSNRYCEALGIDPPALESAREHSAATPYSLLIVALFERGGPMTLEEVAARFAEASIAPADEALRSLKRCRPARAPVYRHGDHYELDPYDRDADLWLFRLGLRPPRVPRMRLVKPKRPPLPDASVAITKDELREAFTDGSLSSWSAQRLALAILDSHGRRLAAHEVVAVMNGLTKYHPLREEAARYWRRGAAIQTTECGYWTMEANHAAVKSMRTAVRLRIESSRSHETTRHDPVHHAVVKRRIDKDRKKRAQELAQLRRALLYGFPAGQRPLAAVVVVDVATRVINTYVGEDLGHMPARLESYDLMMGEGIRPLLRRLGFDPGIRRLIDLGPPQKRLTLNRSGRTLAITNELLVRSSCGISRPFGDLEQMWRYFTSGQESKLRRRLEADAKSLFALYQYGHLHGGVRIRWGFLDEWIPAPWRYEAEPGLYEIEQQSHETGRALEAVLGSAPGWSDPWSRVHRLRVVREQDGFHFTILDEDGLRVEARAIQLVRLG